MPITFPDGRVIQGPEPYRGVKEVCEYLGVSESTLRVRLMQDGIPHKRVGNMLRFRLSEIDAWLDARAEAEQSKDVADA